MDWPRLQDALTAGPARRRRRMTRALKELDRADAKARRSGPKPLREPGSGPRDWAPPTAPAPAGRRVARADAGRRPGGAGPRPSPVFLTFLAAAVAGGVLAWAQPSLPSARLGLFAMVVAGWVVSLSLHEFAHAYTGHRAGDDSAAAAGYLTLNPFRYAHPVLSLALPLLALVQGGIGLPGGAVHLHPDRFRSRAWRSAVSAAGPAANLLLVTGAVAIVRACAETVTHPVFWAGLAFFAYLQVSVTVLNLLPIPGVDGWGILEPYLPPATVSVAAKVKPFGMLALFLLLSLRPVGHLFASAVGDLAGAGGVPAGLWQLGAGLFRFWQG